MVKKVLLFTSMLFCLASAHAQGVSALLKHGNSITPYYGANAFVEAYNAAVDGDRITLSKGLFTQVDTINKSIHIVGAGFFTGDITYISLPANGTMVISANDVTVDGLNISQISIGAVLNCHILHCYLQNLLWVDSTQTHVNTIIDQCAILNTDYAIYNGQNYTIKNSTINYVFRNRQIANITDCCIYSYNNVCKGIYNYCLLGVSNYRYLHYKTSYHVSTRNYYYNTTVLWLSTCSEYYNNRFFSSVTSSYSYTYYNQNNTTTTSTDYYNACAPNIATPSGCLALNNGTISTTQQAVGVTASSSFAYPLLNRTDFGPLHGTGISYNPDIPRVISSQVDPRTDSTGHINARIIIQSR